MEAIVEIISTVGFPIACVLALGFFIWKIYNQSVTREASLLQEIKESREINGRFAELIAGYEVKLNEIREDVKDIKNDINELKNN